jgi:hypothetical protein
MSPPLHRFADRRRPRAIAPSAAKPTPRKRGRKEICSDRSPKIPLILYPQNPRRLYLFVPCGPAGTAKFGVALKIIVEGLRAFASTPIMRSLA